MKIIQYNLGNDLNKDFTKDGTEMADKAHEKVFSIIITC